ncbi:GNAT family N-acetyltransferase, partial [Cycloclasticus sp. 44_32_T64]
QADARPFYEKNGFQIIGKPFEEANISHIKMIKALAA